MKTDKWILAVPQSSSHGSGSLQKRLWTLTSDFVRIRDYYAHDRSCVATGSKLRHWRYGQAGHWKSYSVCRGIFKFDPMNIHLQSPTSNGWGGAEIGYAFGEELKRRYGNDILIAIEKKNRETPLKFSAQQIRERMSGLLEDIKALPEQPVYWKRAYDLLQKDL